MTRVAESSPPLPPAVRALGWTSFLTDLSSEAIYPLLPAFLRQLGGGGVHLGLVDGVASAIAALARLPAGGLSDRIGRRPLVLVGYGLSALVRPLMAVVGTPAAVIGVRAVDRLGKGIRSAPRDALVTDLVAAAGRGRAFGHIRALDHAGAALGPLVAVGFLLLFPGRERLLFLLTLLPGLLTLAVIARFVREPAGRTAGAPLAPRLSPAQRWLLATVALWSLGAASELFLLRRVGDLGLPDAWAPVVWLGISLAKSGAALVSGRLVDHWSPRTALAVGWVMFAGAYGGLAGATQLVTALPFVVLIGVAYGLIEPAERVLVGRLAAPGTHGGAFGWYTLVQGLMALPAGLVAGALWDHPRAGPGLAFAVTAGFAAAATLLLLAAPRLSGAADGAS